MSEPTQEQVAAARAVLEAHQRAVQEREAAGQQEALRVQMAARAELLAEVKVLWPLDWAVTGGDDSVSLKVSGGIWLVVYPCRAGYAVEAVAAHERLFSTVKPTLPEAVELGRKGLRDVARKLIVAADTFSQGADVPKGE